MDALVIKAPGSCTDKNLRKLGEYRISFPESTTEKTYFISFFLADSCVVKAVNATLYQATFNAGGQPILDGDISLGSKAVFIGKAAFQCVAIRIPANAMSQIGFENSENIVGLAGQSYVYPFIYPAFEVAAEKLFDSVMSNTFSRGLKVQKLTGNPANLLLSADTKAVISLGFATSAESGGWNPTFRSNGSIELTKVDGNIIHVNIGDVRAPSLAISGRFMLYGMPQLVTSNSNTLITLVISNAFMSVPVDLRILASLNNLETLSFNNLTNIIGSILALNFAKLKYVALTDCVDVVGDIKDVVENQATIYRLSFKGTKVTYTGDGSKVFSNLSQMLAPAGIIGQVNIDNFLVMCDKAAWSGLKVLEFPYSEAALGEAGHTALTSLREKGVAVTINQ